MTPPRTEYTFDRVVRMLLTAAGATALFFLLRYLSDVLIPFAVAAVLAYLLNPLVVAFQRKTRSRATAVAMTLVGIGLVGMSAVVIIVPLMLYQIERFQRDIDRLRADLAASYAARTEEPPAAPAEQRPAGEPGETVQSPEQAGKSTLGWVELTEAWEKYREDARAGVPRKERLAALYEAISGTYAGRMVDEAVAFTESARFRELAVSALKSLAVGGLSVVSFLVSVIIGLIGLIIVVVYLVFLLIDYPQYSRTWPSLIPPQYRDQTLEFFREFNRAMRQYFRGQAVVAIITAALLATGFTIIGLPMAVPFGVFVGLLNMVPYLAAVAVVPGVLLGCLRAVESDASLAGSIALVLVVFGVVQVIQDTLVTPRIMGQATGLRPVVILLGVFIWGKLLGFLGLILAIPLTCLAITYYRRYVLMQAAGRAHHVEGGGAEE
jgi:predicted PurR-regulated permease PerM